MSTRKKNLLRRVSNRILALMGRVLPGALTLRPFIHRLRGVKIGKNVFIGDDVYLENEFPEAVELQDGAQICLRTIILAHTNGPGRVIVGPNAFVGTGCVISAAKGRIVRIGAGAVISSCCVVSSDIPDQAFVGQPKPTILGRATVPLTNDIDYNKFLFGLRNWKK